MPKYSLLVETKIHQAKAMANPKYTGYSYRLAVSKMTEKGTVTETMAWVEGIPYSKAHFFSILMTGGH